MTTKEWKQWLETVPADYEIEVCGTGWYVIDAKDVRARPNREAYIYAKYKGDVK